MADATTPPISAAANEFLRDAILSTPDAPAPGTTPVVMPAWATPPAAAPAPVAPPPHWSNNVPPGGNWENYPNTPPANPPSDKPYGLSAEDFETYADALPVIQQVLAAEMRPVLASLKNSQETQEMQFVAQVRDRVEGFDVAVNDPRWEHYLNSRMPGSPFTYRNALEQAHTTRDMRAMGELFNTFTSATGLSNRGTSPYTAAPPAAPAEPTRTFPSTAIQPATHGNPTAVAAPEQKLKWSVYQRASTAYQKGQLSREDFLQVKRVYDPLITSGNIAYDL